ncbi:MAG: gliding motility-associated C-terminal domain-containing protein [Bacteroidales bacterium]|nr:gliding motility-associated C-terminal domain-containing protein [Bacteroidales bacterium]
MEHKIRLKIFLPLVLLALAPLVAHAQPSWSVNPGSYANNMTVTGVINLNYTESADINDVVGAFIGGECRGVAHPIYQPSVERYVFYLMVYSNDESGTVRFKVYDSSTDEELEVTATLAFQVNGIVGSTEAPYVVSAPTLSNEAKLLSFGITGQVGETTIDGNNISLQLPYGTNLSSLVAEFEASPYALVKVGDVVQTSGVTANDFSAPVVYTVRSADETNIGNFTVTVVYANAIPTDIILSGDRVPETLPSGSVVCSLTTADENVDDTHLYTLVSGTGDTDNAFFTVSFNELILNTDLDFESKESYSILLRTEDNNGGAFEKQLTIYVDDETESVANAINVFSPNNDGVNDYWVLENNQTFQSCEFFIFNTLGEILFRSKGYDNNWDGTYNGRQLPVGTYYFLIKCPDCANCDYSGSISIIR